MCEKRGEGNVTRTCGCGRQWIEEYARSFVVSIYVLSEHYVYVCEMKMKQGSKAISFHV